MDSLRDNTWRFYLVAGFLVLGICGELFLAMPSASIVRPPLSNFPEIIGNWRCVSKSELAPGVMEILKVDDYIMRTYMNDNGSSVGFYVGYFEKQCEGKQIHSPRQCLSGAGWTRIKHREVSLPLTGEDSGRWTDTSVNVDIMAKGNDRELYVWWYQGRGRIYSNEYMNRIYLMWDSLTKRRSDGALVRINLSAGKNMYDSLVLADSFINAVLPQLSKFIPK